MAVDPNELYDQLMRQNSAEQDIQAIAKQISDHAEAIYQTWKSKGLTPNELLHLHSTDAENAASGELPASSHPATPFRPHSRSAATATSERRSSITSERPKSGSSLSPVELLASPQLDATLEQLVNSFVQEDKARLAARVRTASPAPMSPTSSTSSSSSITLSVGHPIANSHLQQGVAIQSPSPIQTALKRFEKKGLNYESARSRSLEPEGAVRASPSFQEAVQSANTSRTSASVPAMESTSSDTVKSRAQRFASRIEMANAASHSSLSWPVKRVTSTSPGPTEIHKVTVVAEVAAHHPVSSSPSNHVALASTTEVDKEEEKLINALKTGQVIDEVTVTTTPTAAATAAAPSDHFHQSMVKKTRERHQQQQQRAGVTSVRLPGPVGNPEEELETLVDRLKGMEPPVKAVSVSRESSPAPNMLALRDGSPSRSTSPRSVKLSETVPVAGVSAVDYAKVRYQTAQANPLTQQRLEDSRTIGKAPNTPQPNVVSATRSRFEGQQQSSRTTANSSAVPWRSNVHSNEWSPVRPPGPAGTETTDDNGGQQQPAGALNLDALRRMKTRKMRKSPEPQQPSSGSNTSSPTSSPLPHPELTVQQKQHLRERNQQQQQQQQGVAGAHQGSSTGLAVQYTSTGIPIRPFLTRGSVAERVLIFEKCPTAIASDLANKADRTSGAGSNAAAGEKSKRAGSPAPQNWRHSNNDVQTRAQVYAKDNNKENRSTSTGVSSPRSTLRRQAKANNNLLLPRFYYPTGRPISKEQLDASLQRLAATFQQLPNCQASREDFGTIAKACGCPYYWKAILFIASGGEKLGHVTLETFTDFWAKILNNYHDEASRFVQLLTMINPNVSAAGRTDNNLNGPSLNNSSGGGSGRFYLVPEDFVPLVQDVVDTHPGLTFLKEAAEFHSRYVHTVIARIYYNVNRSWSGQVTLAELRHSNLLATIRLLEEEEDINQITDFFSYEHFYVIYCKFWELDKDHDLFIDKKDLARHNDHALSSKMIDRIFSGAVTRGASQNNRLAKLGNLNHQPRMSYTEFVWFLISEEDKRHPTAIEYWFRCMDLDGDGYLSMYELEYFYEEQLQRMESLGIETLPFEDCLCQMLDMIHPAVAGKVSLNDLKRCQMTPIFFDTFFNLEKYLDHEQRDPFASQRDPDSENGDEILKISDWDRYAAEEYELLVAEEGGPDHSDDMFMREEMNATEDDNGDHHSGLSLSMERDVIMAESDATDDHDDYSPLQVHSSLGLGNSGHRSLFSVTPCSIEYQY